MQHQEKIMSRAVILAVAAGGLWLFGLRLKRKRRERDAIDSAAAAAADQRKQHVYRIVLTGGPCAGKTTALVRLSGYLSERGFRVYTVPEAATMLFVNGVAFSDFEGDEAVLSFQASVLDLQTTLENAFERVAISTKSPAVLLCDRGALDGSAYMDRSLWLKLLSSRRDELLSSSKKLASAGKDDRKQFVLTREIKEHEGGLLEAALCERYDAVFHMVTAADGAERHYSLENNAARSEAPEAARDADARTQRAWAPHPRHLIFDNSAVEFGFEGKLQRVVEATARLVGLPVLPKSTRKFVLLSTPTPDVFVEHDVDFTAFDVTKTFLKQSTQSSYSYVRLRSQGNSDSYGHATVNVDQTTGERIERKRKCTEFEYRAYLANADPDREPVKQRRLHFLFENQSFVIHQYLDRDCSIIHCQAARADGTANFPSFLWVGNEITHDLTFSAHHLSHRSNSVSSTTSSLRQSMRRPSMTNTITSDASATTYDDEEEEVDREAAEAADAAAASAVAGPRTAHRSTSTTTLSS